MGQIIAMVFQGVKTLILHFPPRPGSSGNVGNCCCINFQISCPNTDDSRAYLAIFIGCDGKSPDYGDRNVRASI